MNTERQAVLTILMMRFGLNPYVALPLAKEWLEIHSHASWDTLKKLLLSGGVIFKNGILHDITPREIKILTNQMRGQNGIEIKNRWYSLKLYPKCFIGSEAVEWFIKTQQVTREESIQIGEILIARQIIHHVHNEHNFKDEYLFYRFYIDETQPDLSISTPGLALGNISSRIIEQDLV